MNKNEISNLYKDLDFEEAVSHRIHTRIFEIIGYLDIIDKERLAAEDQVYIDRIKTICKKMINELHNIIDHYGKI